MLTRRTALCLAAAAPAAAQARRLVIRGLYSNPKPFWDKGAKLDEWGVNAVFVGAGSVNRALMERAAAEGARVFAEFPTLNGKGYVDKHPEAWPVNEQGQKAPPATWFMGVCPTDPAFRAFRMKQLEDLLDQYDVAGVWMDYLHWHAQFEDPKPVLPETCFSESCVAAFEKASGVRVPPGDAAQRARRILDRHDEAWRSWRVRQVAGWARGIKDILAKKRPKALLGMFHCPWTDGEFAGARRRILGLDLDALGGVVDVYSPMVYHGRMGRAEEWVGSYVSWLGAKLGSRADVWPIVQATNEPRPIPAEEFEGVLRLAAADPADGVMIFTAQAVASDPAKMDAMRRVYREML